MTSVCRPRLILGFIMIFMMTILPLAEGMCFDRVHEEKLNCSGEPMATDCCAGVILSTNDDCCLQHHDCLELSGEKLQFFPGESMNAPTCPVVFEAPRSLCSRQSRVSFRIFSAEGLSTARLSTHPLILRI